MLIPFILLVINKLVFMLVKDDRKVPIGNGDLIYLSLIGLMFGFPIQLMSIVLSSLIMAVGLIIHKYKEIPWGYYLTISTIILIIITPYIRELIDLLNVGGW
jgi:prepilin signal peptidase PulO-like enzyme (type II secretory pathway)